MSSLLRHGRYIARISYDEEDGVFHGIVMNCAPDYLEFYGSDDEELRHEFAASVEVYEETCKEQGLEPKFLSRQELLDRLDDEGIGDDFEELAEEILEKSEELYRRLAGRGER